MSGNETWSNVQKYLKTGARGAIDWSTLVLSLPLAPPLSANVELIDILCLWVSQYSTQVRKQTWSRPLSDGKFFTQKSFKLDSAIKS